MPFWKRDQLSPEEQGVRDEVRAAERRLKEAERAHESRVKESRMALDQTRKNHERSVRDAKHRAEEAAKRKKLGSLAGVTLYENWIVTPHGESQLSPEVTAVCDTAGNIERTSRVTVTRLLAFGIFAFGMKKKKVHDDRELYLVMEAPEFMSAQKIDPKLGNVTRQFAAKIVTAAKQAPNAIARREQAILQANAELQGVTADTSRIEAAEADLVDVEGDTGAVERCRSELAELRAPMVESRV